MSQSIKNQGNAGSQQVQVTGDWSADSKLSAIHYKYWEDPFFRFFNLTEPIPRRTSLICRGYAVRFVVCDYFLRNILRNIDGPFQIVSIGCGMDSLYFRLFPEFGDMISGFFELDFEDVIEMKKGIIEGNPLLSTMSQDKIFYVPGDLRMFSLVYFKLKNTSFDPTLPTIFYSECVVNYLTFQENQAILQCIAKNVPNSIWLAYEQCSPEDSFGQIMTKHFEKNGFPLLAIQDCPNPDSQAQLLINADWTESKVFNVWDCFETIFKESGNQSLFPQLNTEQFDEYESLLITCLHYSVRFGLNGSLLDSSVYKFISNFAQRIQIHCPSSFSISQEIPLKQTISDLQIFNTQDQQSGHTTFSINGSIFTLGGFGGNSQRISSLQEWRLISEAEEKSLEAKPILINPKFFQRVHPKCVYVPKLSCLFLFGGRKSPNQPSENGIICLTYSDDSFQLPNEIDLSTSPNSGDEDVFNLIPISRWRHSLDYIQDANGNAHLILFGGLNDKDTFGDLCLFDISNKIWTQKSWNSKSDIESKTYPSSRHSHSTAIDHERRILYIIGGMSSDGGTLCKDAFWSYNFDENTSSLSTSLSPVCSRVGHSSIYVKESNHLLIIGGYGANSSYDFNQFLLIINLGNNEIRSYDLDLKQLFLPFGFSCHYNSDDKRLLVFGGGGSCFSFGTHLNKIGISFTVPLD